MSNNIIKFRNLNNWTQKKVAQKIGITTSYLGMMEIGMRTPSLEIAYKIAKLFNVSIEEIFFETQNTKMVFINIISQKEENIHGKTTNKIATKCVL